MIVQMVVEEHKLSGGNVLLCLGTQSKSDSQSQVVVYQLDPKLDFEVIESFRWIWPEEQITSVYYKAGCGLILSSFTGYMEIYDAVNVNQSLWPTQRKPRPISSDKRQSYYKHGPISTVCYSDALDIIAFSGVKGIIYILDQETKNRKDCV